MVRAVLLGILMTSALGACKSSDSPPTAQPGAVAGNVVEVTGTVSVAGKPLAVGDAVKTDDAVETGADGSVVIVLAHNQARWELGPNHKVKASESLAWTAAQSTGSAAQVDQATSAAGRPAERNAADTEATSATPKTGAPPAPRSQTTPPASSEAPPVQPQSATEPMPPGQAVTASPAPRAQHAVQLPPSKDEGKSDGLVGAENERSGAGATDAKKADPTKQDLAPLMKLASCVPSSSSVHIKAHIANHKVTVVFLSDVNDSVKACIRTAAAKLSLTVDGDVTLTLTQ